MPVHTGINFINILYFMKYALPSVMVNAPSTRPVKFFSYGLNEAMQ